ncbi:hypothetical protein H6P81_014516 [Aristolochia fimbriata]|uniref:Uncharacterized protein n=1 Tax=Aristolochia fimbriata TaxID=158543 RepID=A0AAV7EHR5_ARIFI|nr:hypothetical protein H6P81_014516 [Aristolochia fimbriata]
MVITLTRPVNARALLLPMESIGRRSRHVTGQERGGDCQLDPATGEEGKKGNLRTIATHGSRERVRSAVAKNVSREEKPRAATVATAAAAMA